MTLTEQGWVLPELCPCGMAASISLDMCWGDSPHPSVQVWTCLLSAAVEPTHLCQHQKFYLKLPVPVTMGFKHGALQHPHTLRLPLLMQLVSFLDPNVLDCHDSSEKGTQIL